MMEEVLANEKLMAYFAGIIEHKREHSEQLVALRNSCGLPCFLGTVFWERFPGNGSS